MGCSICLDSYEDDADKSRRPVALPCGHIFHKYCCDGWLKTCRMRSDVPTCPICKVLIGSGRPLSLYPSDVNDIDLYLSNRHKFAARQIEPRDRVAAPGTTALDRYMSRENQAKLLERLMDFRLHISSYVMGVNDVRMNYRGTDDDIYRLFSDLNRGRKDKERDFNEAIGALKEVTENLNECINDTESKRQEIDDTHRQILAEAAQQHMQRAEIAKGLHDKMLEEQRMHKERGHVKTLQMHLKNELSKQERRKKEMDQERKAYIQEANEKAHEALKVKVETAQQVAQSKGESESVIESMRQYCIDQELLRIKAEEEARAANEKSSQLADRVKILSSKLSDSRAANGRMKKSRSSAGRNSVSVKEEDRDDMSRATRKGKARQESLSLLAQTEMDEDGFTIIDSKNGSVRSTPSLSHSAFGGGLYNGSSIKRSRFSNEIDDNSIQVVDSDGDDDDKSFIMPGFGVQYAPAAAASSSMIMSTPARVYQHRPSGDIQGDSSVEYLGDSFNTFRRPMARPSNYSNHSNGGLIDTINNARVHQFGPRLRNR